MDFSKDPEVKKWLSELQSDFAEELGKSTGECNDGKEESKESNENGGNHLPKSLDMDKQAVNSNTGSEAAAINRE